MSKTRSVKILMKMPLNNNWAAFFIFVDRKRLLLPLYIHEQENSRKYERQDKCRKGMAPQTDNW